jgi:hypothetical protein
MGSGEIFQQSSVMRHALASVHYGAGKEMGGGLGESKPKKYDEALHECKSDRFWRRISLEIITGMVIGRNVRLRLNVAESTFDLRKYCLTACVVAAFVCVSVLWV